MSEPIYLDVQAKYVTADSKTAAVLVHQSGRHMHSWALLAEALRKNNIASVATDKSRRGDVVASVKFLNSRGYNNVILVGASQGGARCCRQ